MMLDDLLSSQGTPPPLIRVPSWDTGPGMLRPGQGFAREARAVRGGRVEILDVPCCGRSARVPAPASQVAADPVLVLCIPCRRAWRADLESEGDGGWAAILTLDEIEFTTTRKPA